MKYDINKKNVKQSIKNLKDYFNSKGISIPHNNLLEGMAKVFFAKNWNTLEGLMTKSKSLDNIKTQKKYLIEIQINCSKLELLYLLKASFKEAKCLLNIVEYQEFEDSHQITVDLSENNNNILTAFLILSNKLKKTDYSVKKLDIVRFFVEKESLTKLFNLSKS